MEARAKVSFLAHVASADIGRYEEGSKRLRDSGRGRIGVIGRAGWGEEGSLVASSAR